MVELLAPAGDLARLKTAVIYGADAVYFGGKQFSLRARASNFTIENIAEAVQFAHERNSKVYVTVNIIPHNGDFAGLEEYLQKLQEIGVDAIICASGAIAETCRRYAPKLEVHISTQQTTINSLAIKYWQNKGADRIVLGREVTMDQLHQIEKNSTLPIEVFIHGGMCANYSGRCTISNLLTNRDANRGGCAQSCRWDYHLFGPEGSLDKEDHLFTMGSKDMCAVDCLQEILQSSVISLKIEGRMKTAYYIATVVKGYRYLIDCFNEKGYITDEELAVGRSYIYLATNRDSFAGFYPGVPKSEGTIFNTVSQVHQSFLANVVGYDEATSTATIEVRNNFKVGDRIAIMNPEGLDTYFTVDEMLDEEGNSVTVANKPMQLLTIKVPVKVDENTFIHTGALR